MIKREIFGVYANIIDANGTFNALSGYPKLFDSKNYDNDINKAKQRAYGEWHEALGAMGKRDDRQLQLAYIIRMSDGMLIEGSKFGAIADLPDPEPEVEPEVEPDEGVNE